jgi:hypothetical protein
MKLKIYILNDITALLSNYCDDDDDYDYDDDADWDLHEHQHIL